MNNQLHILIIEDEQGIIDDITEFFEGEDYRLFSSTSPLKAFDILAEEEIDIILLDIRLPEMNGIEVLKIIKKEYPHIEVIMITGHGDMKTVIETMRLGAGDFINKPFRMIEIQNAIERTKRFIQLNNKLKDVELKYSRIKKELNLKTGFDLIGKSKEFMKVLELMKKVAQTDDTSVLITGESGTGKELIARGTHFLGKRKNNTFYAMNCSAITETLFESELFGYKKGTFTGAYEDKPGSFEMANNGTLFLDEIGDMSLNLQAKLLRVLDEKKIKRVGSHREIPIDVRIVAATNRKIEKLILEKKFRLDLFHRLNTFEINIPPLRKRKQDIPILLEYFIALFSKKQNKIIKKVEQNVYDKIDEFEFTGNVRELKNLVERALILCDQNILKLEHFPALLNRKLSSIPGKKEKTLELEKVEKNLLIEVLEMTDNNKSKAAEILNITWSSLNRRLKKHKLEYLLKENIN